MTVTMESAVFMGKNYLNNCQSIANTIDLTLKQMFDVSTRLVSEQDEISGLDTIGWENHSWKHLSLIGDDRVINLQRTKVYIFSDSVLCLGKILEKPNRTMHGNKRLGWFKSSSVYRALTESTVSQWNSSGIFSQAFNTSQLSEEFKSSLLRLGETPDNFIGRILFYVDVQRHFLWNKRTMNKNVWQMPNSYLCTREDLEKDNGHSLVLALKRNGTVSVKTGQNCRKDVVGIR